MSNKPAKNHPPSTLERLNKPLVHCRCGKVFSPTEADARRVKKSVEKHKGHTTDQVRFYQCRYSGWHWTTKIHDIRPCRSCQGRFRPANEQPANTTLCDTCRKIHEERSAQEKLRRETAAARAAEARRRAEAARVARIIAEARPTPAMFDRNKTA